MLVRSHLSHRKQPIGLRNLCVQGQLRKRIRHTQQHRLACHADEGIQRLVIKRMAKQEKAHSLSDLFAPLPEQLFPAEFAHQLEQSGVARQDHHAFLVEQRERVARRGPVAGFLGGQRLVMARVDCCFGRRERHPHQCVEHIVPVQRAHLHFTFQKGALLEAFLKVLRLRRLRNKPHAQPLSIDHSAGIVGNRIERFRIRPADLRKTGADGPQRRKHAGAVQPVRVPVIGHASTRVRSGNIRPSQYSHREKAS